MSRSALSFTLLAACLWLVGAPAIAQTVATPAPQPGPSLYAVNSAALASAMTYCISHHGDLQKGSPGEACFLKARQVLANWGLKQVSVSVDATCNDPRTFNTCLTPQIGKLVYALNAEFAKQKL